MTGSAFVVLGLIASAQQPVELAQQRGLLGYRSGVTAAIAQLPGGPVLVMSSEFWGGGEQQGYLPYWLTIEPDPSGTADTRRIWARPHSDVIAVGSGDVSGDALPEAVILLADGTVEVHDLVTRARLVSFPGLPGAVGMSVAQADADARLEIHLISPAEYAAYDGGGGLEWRTSAISGAGVLVAQLDGDAAFEAVSHAGQVLDLSTLTLQWTLPEPALDLDAADLDLDGDLELVLLRHGGPRELIQIWDVGGQTLQSQLIDPGWAGHSATCIRAADVDRDGAPEILCGFRDVYLTAATLLIWDAETGSILKHVTSSVLFALEVLVADLDRDAKTEVALIGGNSFSVITPFSDLPLHEQAHGGMLAHYAGPAIGDLDGDGFPEVAMVGQNRPEGDLIIECYDARDLARRAVSDGAPDLLRGLAEDVKIRDLDGDGRGEILIAGTEYAGRGGNGFARAYSLAPNEPRLVQTWRAGRPDPDPRSLGSIEASDLNHDGRMEVFVGERDVGRRGSQVIGYHYPGGEILRIFDQIGPRSTAVISSLAAGDLDGNGSTELLALVKGHGLFVFDASSPAPRGRFLHPFTSLNLGADARGALMFLGDEDGRALALRFRAGRGLSVEWSTRRLTAPVRGVAPGPDGTAWVLAEGRLHRVDPIADQVLWVSEDYGWQESYPGLILAGDPSRPGGILMASPHALLGFQIR